MARRSVDPRRPSWPPTPGGRPDAPVSLAGGFTGQAYTSRVSPEPRNFPGSSSTDPHPTSPKVAPVADTRALRQIAAKVDGVASYLARTLLGDPDFTVDDRSLAGLLEALDHIHADLCELSDETGSR